MFPAQMPNGYRQQLDHLYPVHAQKSESRGSCGQVGILDGCAEPDAAEGLVTARKQITRWLRRDANAPGQDEHRVHLHILTIWTAAHSATMWTAQTEAKLPVGTRNFICAVARTQHLT